VNEEPTQKHFAGHERIGLRPDCPTLRLSASIIHGDKPRAQRPASRRMSGPGRVPARCELVTAVRTHRFWRIRTR